MAGYFEWLESYSVGVQTFDDAHKQLLGITNDFVTAAMEGKPQDELTDHLIELVRYTHYHFRDEEEQLKETDYDLFAEHRAQHDELFDKVLEFTHGFYRGKFDKHQISEFMMSWLLSHILDEDLKYKEHFAKLGRR